MSEDPTMKSENAPSMSLVGERVGKYEIVREIGRGGMGMVYEALNTTIGKRVAMKFVDSQGATQETAARFQREAQAASAVESAHIVEIFDSGVTDAGVPYIVMELLRGEDLGQRIKRVGRLELGEALHIVAQILKGLHRAHEAGIVHRDLKPDNVFLVEREDEPVFTKILDFGISKVRRGSDVPANTLTRQGTVLGTPYYMSPEQAQALPDVDGRADLFSVGAILFECLTGRPPHQGTTYEQVIIAICMKDADDVRMHNPGVPEGIAEVLATALKRDRESRFASAREFLDKLVERAQGVLPSRRSDEFAISASPPRITPKTPRGIDTAMGLETTVGISNNTGPGVPVRSASKGVIAAAILVIVSLAAGGIWVRSQLATTATEPTRSVATSAEKARVEATAERQAEPAPEASAVLATPPPIEAAAVHTKERGATNADRTRRTLPVASSSPKTPKPEAPAPPRATGVAGGLQIKTE